MSGRGQKHLQPCTHYAAKLTHDTLRHTSDHQKQAVGVNFIQRPPDSGESMRTVKAMREAAGQDRTAEPWAPRVLWSRQSLAVRVRPREAAHPARFIPLVSEHIAGGAPAPIVPVWHSIPVCLLSELLLVAHVILISPAPPRLAVVRAPVVPVCRTGHRRNLGLTSSAQRGMPIRRLPPCPRVGQPPRLRWCGCRAR